MWPIGTGVPCVGCTEKGVVWQMGTFETVPIHLATPPDTYPPIYSTAGKLRSERRRWWERSQERLEGRHGSLRNASRAAWKRELRAIAADRAHAEKLKAQREAGRKKED